MPGTIHLKVIDGPLTGAEFSFSSPGRAIFGRSQDCGPTRLPDADRTVSRHHFALDVNPPEARLRDLASLDGTYVNGQLFGGRHLGEADCESEEVLLRDGDTLRAGKTVLKVRIELPAPYERVDLGARFRVRRQLHAGTSGVTYLADDARSGQRIALKVALMLAAQRGAPAYVPATLDRFRALRHPCVVTLNAHGTALDVPDTYFASMEFCEGGSLAATHWRDGQLSGPRSVPLMLGVLDGLAVLHEHGLAHRHLTEHSLLWARDARADDGWRLKIGLPRLPDRQQASSAAAQFDDVQAIASILLRLFGANSRQAGPMEERLTRLLGHGLSVGFVAAVELRQALAAIL